uniref:F-box/LRR-repeat protein 20, related n=1 Tax=Neospora caninum (strain Liverpool) TaxID=572307 RepID=A0A0F7U9Y5_NEOCL|nr:TPA: F-box/LRR-repeat protein 20, related [Neospora caninum Liverpool]
MVIGRSPLQSKRRHGVYGVAEQKDAVMSLPGEDTRRALPSTSGSASSLSLRDSPAGEEFDCLRAQRVSQGKARIENFEGSVEDRFECAQTDGGRKDEGESSHAAASLAPPPPQELCGLSAEEPVSLSPGRHTCRFSQLERGPREADECSEGARKRQKRKGAQVSSAETRCFADFPQEVLELIFLRLGLADLSRCLCVAKSWHPALNAVFSKTVVSLGTSRRLLLTDAQLEALLKRCPEVHTVELDCFLLTPRGAGRLGTAPNLKSLSLTSVDHQTDAFFYALAAAVPDLDSFSIAIFDRSKHITNAALEHLAGRLRKLQAFSVEFSFRENLDFFVLALTTASLHTLRHVALHDVSQDCLVQLTAAVGKNLLSFSYTKTSSTSLPISDWLLQYLPLRMPRLTSLRLIDAVTPGVLAQVSSPFASLFVSGRRRRRRRRESEHDRERERERLREEDRTRSREASGPEDTDENARGRRRARCPRERREEALRDREEPGREPGRDEGRRHEQPGDAEPRNWGAERERGEESARSGVRDVRNATDEREGWREEWREGRGEERRDWNGGRERSVSSASEDPASGLRPQPHVGSPPLPPSGGFVDGVEERARNERHSRTREEEDPEDEPRALAQGHAPRNAQRICLEKVPPLVSPAGLSCLRPLAGHLEVLALSRSFGLPFTHATDVDLLQFFADFSPRLRELELNGFTRMSDGFLHEVLVACAGSNVSAAPPASVSSPRASTLSPSSASPPLRGPSGASGFKLKKLSLEAADISDLGLHAIATALGNTAETLCLKRCSSLSEAGHSAIAEYCRNLTSLNLGFCSGVNDLSVCCLLQSCPSLRTLVLNDARISDVALKAIGDCLGENLFELALHRSDKITNEGLRVLARACPNLVLLSLSSCSQVTDAGVVEIAESCRRLLKLRLDGTRVTDVAIRAVGQSLRRLRYLHLQRCSHVTGESLSFFSAETHPCLKCIELSESRRKVSKDQIRAFRERNRPATALLLGEAATGD